MKANKPFSTWLSILVVVLVFGAGILIGNRLDFGALGAALSGAAKSAARESATPLASVEVTNSTATAVVHAPMSATTSLPVSESTPTPSGPAPAPRDSYNFDYTLVTTNRKKTSEAIEKTSLAIPYVENVIDDVDPLVKGAFELDKEGNLFPANNGMIEDKPGLDLPWGYLPPENLKSPLGEANAGAIYYSLDKAIKLRQEREKPFVYVFDTLVKRLKHYGLSDEDIKRYLPEISAAALRTWTDENLMTATYGGPSGQLLWLDESFADKLKEEEEAIIDAHAYIIALSIKEGNQHKPLEDFDFSTRVELLSPAYLSFLIHPSNSGTTRETLEPVFDKNTYVGEASIELLPLDHGLSDNIVYVDQAGTNFIVRWPEVFEALKGSENDSSLGGFPTIDDYEKIAEQGPLYRWWINKWYPGFLQPIEFTSIPVYGDGKEITLMDRYLGPIPKGEEYPELKPGTPAWQGLERLLEDLQAGKTPEEKELLLKRARLAHAFSDYGKTIYNTTSGGTVPQYGIVNPAFIGTYFEAAYHIPVIVVGYPVENPPWGNHHWGVRWAIPDFSRVARGPGAVTDLAFCGGENCSNPLTAIDWGKKVYFIPYSDYAGVGFRLSDQPTLP